MLISSDLLAPGCGVTDGELLRRIQESEEEAAALLYRRYARRLRAFARVHCSLELSARLEPEDIVQGVFLSFFQQASQGKYHLSGNDDLWKLLVVIALNHIRSAGEYHRAAKRDVRLTRGSSDPALQEGYPSRTEQGFNELRLFLEDLLEQFPPSQQRLVQLRLEGYEVAEIASLTGQSKRTVERGLHDFRRALQTKLEQDLLR